METVNASTICELLAIRHSKDVFVAQCRTGPAHGGSLQVMDAWAMRRSYSKPCAWCYEIKVSRSDFLRDEKWMGYLDYCNQFYFVTPPKLVAPEEVPECAGLLCVSRTGTRLYTKKAAPYRQVELPEDLYRYILFSRARIGGEYCAERQPQRDYWRRWLQTKKDDQELGYRVGRKLRKLFSERVDEVASKNRVLERENEKLDDVKRFLEELGVSVYDWNVQQRIKEALSGFPPELEASAKRTNKVLGELLEIIGAMKPRNGGRDADRR